VPPVGRFGITQGYPVGHGYPAQGHMVTHGEGPGGAVRGPRRPRMSEGQPAGSTGYPAEGWVAEFRGQRREALGG